MKLISPEGRDNRRGCLLIASLVALTIFVIIALGSGWMGRVDGSKNTDLPVVDGGNQR
jgi:hypothetical protein